MFILIANKLTLNSSKTEFLSIGSRQRLSNVNKNLEIKINQTPVEQVAHTKPLGLYIDQNLHWQFHILEMSKKTPPGISAIKRIRNFVSREILLTIYNSLIQPHFDYCSKVWGSCSKGLSQKLQTLQIHAAHITTFSNYVSNTNQLFCVLNWNKLNHQRDVRNTIMMCKAVNNQTPGYLSSRSTPRLDVLNYNLRNDEYTLCLQGQI